MYGRKHTTETIKKISESKKGKHNGEKNGMYGRKGDKAINSTKVYMYNDKKELIKVFNTVGMALEFLGITSHSALYKACRNGTVYRGYYWKKEYR